MSSINPSFHKTAIIDNFAKSLTTKYYGLSQEKREEYGRDFHLYIRQATVNATAGCFDPKHVVNAMRHAVTGANPRHEYLVGMDGRLYFCLLNMVPPRVRDRLVSLHLGTCSPAACLKEVNKASPQNKSNISIKHKKVIDSHSSSSGSVATAVQ